MSVDAEPPATAEGPAGRPLPAPLAGGRRGRPSEAIPDFDRSLLARVWYRIVQGFVATIMGAVGGLRASGRGSIPASGPVLLVSNHLSHLDVLVLGILLDRPLNYVARSSLFFPPLGALIRSLGAFPINRDGMGAEGFKETLRRVRRGGIVTLFPEGTRTVDGEIGEMKSGIARLVMRSGAVVVPAAIAGTFEAWPRSSFWPVPHPLRVHFGQPISIAEMARLDPEALTDLIRSRIQDCQAIARQGLARDLR